MGLVAPGFEVGVVGVDKVLGPGEEGELCIRTDVGGGSKWIFKGAFIFRVLVGPNPDGLVQDT